MKKIILILLVLIACINSEAQFIQRSYQGNSGTLMTSRGGYTALKGIVNTMYLDTTEANLDTNFISHYDGGMVQIQNRIYTRWNNTWYLVGGGDGFLFGVDDSTASANRYFNARNNFFTFDSVGVYDVFSYDISNTKSRFHLDSSITYGQVYTPDFLNYGTFYASRINSGLAVQRDSIAHYFNIYADSVVLSSNYGNPNPKIFIHGINDGDDTTSGLGVRLVVMDGDQVKTMTFPAITPLDTSNLSHRIDTTLKILYVDTTGLLRLRDSVLSSVPFNGIFSNGLISTGGITLLDSTITILPNIVFARNDTVYTLTSSASFIINSTSTGYFRTDLIYVDSNNVVQHLVGVQDTVITSAPALPYKGIQIAVVDVHNSVITSSVTPTNNNWSTLGNAITTDSLFGTTTNNGLKTIIGNAPRALYPATGGFGLYGISLTQMNAIPSPLTGTIVYINDDNFYYYYNGSAWVKIGSGGGGGLLHVVGTNGLSNRNDSTVQLGGSFTKSDTLTMGAFNLVLTGSNAQNLYSINSASGSGLRGQSTSGYGIEAYSTSGVGGAATSVSNIGFVAQSTSSMALQATIGPAVGGNISTVANFLNNPSVTPANGLGSKVLLSAANSVGSNDELGAIQSYWTDVTFATKTSRVELEGANGGLYQIFASFQPGGVVPVNNFNDTLATKAYARSLKVDSIWRTAGTDSIKFSIGGRYRAIKDSTGGSSFLAATQIEFGSVSNTPTSSADLTWDNTNKILTVGSPGLGSSLNIDDGNTALFSGYATIADGSGGSVTIDATGGSGNILTSGSVAAGYPGGAPPSAILSAQSTTKGFLAPTMTTTQRDAIASPATGLEIYNTTTSTFNYYNGISWVTSGNGIVKQTHTSGTSVTVSNATTWLVVNPASILSSLAVTLPSSPYDGQDVLVSFGGTITGAGVVTAISFSPTPIDASTPDFVMAGESIGYRWNATNSKWYRVK